MGRTNITVKDPVLWKWAKKRAVDLEMDGVSEYLFQLIETDQRRQAKRRDSSEGARSTKAR